MSLKDIISPDLVDRPELTQGPPSYRELFQGEFHEVLMAFYPGLVTALVHFKREGLRIMLEPHEGINPHHLILNAKMQTGITLSLHDRAVLKMAGVEVPREAGRYKDLFE